jgi:hypothetical protein
MNTLELKAPDGNEDCHLPWEFESQAGIHLDLYNPNTSIQFIVVAGKQEGRTKICWFDLNTLEYLCEHQFNDMDGCEVRVLSVSPLMPCFENTVSVAKLLRPVLSVGILGAKSRGEWVLLLVLMLMIMLVSLDAYMYVNVSPEFILKYAKEIQIANKLITRMTTTR